MGQVQQAPFSAAVKYIDPNTPSGFTRVGFDQFALQAANLGGVVTPDAAEAAEHQFVTAYDPDTGTFTQGQPSFAGITGAATPAQLPGASTVTQGAITLAGDLDGTPESPKVVNTSLTAPLPIDQGGNGSANPGLVAGENITVEGAWPAQRVSANTSGFTGTITTAKLTSGGANGSMTFTNGLLTAQVAAT